MLLEDALKNKKFHVEYYKDKLGDIVVNYNNKDISLDEFEKLVKTDKDARSLYRATMAQNFRYPKQVKKFKDLVADLFHQKTKTPDIEISKERIKVYSGRIIMGNTDPKIDTKEIETSKSKDLIAPPWIRKLK